MGTFHCRSTCLLIVVVLSFTYSLPVTQKKENEPSTEAPPAKSDLQGVLEYERYLKEVVDALESDPDFRKKLDSANDADIRSGKIAQELEYVSHHVRSKLDEIKRRELDRLRKLASKAYELSNDIDREHLKIPEHLDHDNAHTFEIEDLEKLIKKAAEDLDEADQKRREEFKEYEMQKEFEKQAALKELDEEKQKAYEEDLRKQREQHNKHERVHHPGNKAQLEEVWEQQDHMQGEEFDPKTFFMIHDVDGNGYWDETEVKALFVKELDKVYQSGVPEDDMRERAEEMERMREHVFKESDTNRDGLISYKEFLEQTKRDEFQRDPGWETVDNIPQFTHEEYLEFERRRQEEVQRMINEGLLPAHPNMPQGYYPGPGGAYQVHPNQAGNNHPNQYQQQQHYQQNPVGQQHAPPMPPHGNPQYHPNAQYHQNSISQQQQQQQQQHGYVGQHQPIQQQQYQQIPQGSNQQHPQPVVQHYEQAPQHQQMNPQQVNLNNNQVYQTVSANIQQQQQQQQNIPPNNNAQGNASPNNVQSNPPPVNNQHQLTNQQQQPNVPVNPSNNQPPSQQFQQNAGQQPKH